MNKIVISGNTCNELSLQNTVNGFVATNIRVAVNRPYKAAEDKQQTDFFNCRAFGKLAERCVEKLEMGRKVIIVGEMHLDRFKDEEGNTRIVPTVIVESCEFVYPQNKEDNYENTLREKKPKLEEESEPQGDLPF